MSSLIHLSGEVQVLAAGRGKQAGRRIKIMAYGGGDVLPAGYDRRLVIDLSGLTIPDTFPLLADHENRLERIVGSGFAEVLDNQLHAVGTLATNDAGNDVATLIEQGVPLQASVGVMHTELVEVPAGEQFSTNGRTFTAPYPRGLYLAKQAELKEISILPLGADSSTSVTIAAAAAQGNTTMTSIPATTTTPDEIIRAERERYQQIDRLCTGDWPDQGHVAKLRAQAIDGELSIDGLRANLLDILRSSRVQAGAFCAQNSGGAVLDRETLEANLMLRAGHDSLAVATYGERTAETAKRIRVGSMVEFCAAALQIDGTPTGGMPRSEMIKLAMSTKSVPQLLANVQGKTLLPSYQEATASWRGFARIMPAANFKPQNAIRPSFIGNLEELPATGEIKHGTMDEDGVPWSIATYAKMFSISRQDIINDDLGAFADLPEMLGRAAGRSLSDLVWGTILANVANFFHSSNGNLLEAGSDLSLTSLGAAVAKMRSQRDADGNDISIVPRVLAVPPELETLARSILNSSEVQPSLAAGIAAPTGNALKGIAELAVESRLSNTVKFGNASAAGWYLFAGPADVPVLVGFLDGIQTPTIETFGLDHEAHNLSMSFRCYHDYGATLGDHRAAVKATGEVDEG